MAIRRRLSDWSAKDCYLKHLMPLEMKLMKSFMPVFMRKKFWSIVSSGFLCFALVACNSEDSPDSPSYSVGGTLNGLANGQSIVLQNNSGDDLILSTNGGFVFVTNMNRGTTYDVSVKTQPNGQTCTASANKGSVDANVSSIVVTCSNYSVGGTLNGLANGQSIVLQNNGGDDLTLSANGSFVFGTNVTRGTAYDVSVKTQPNGQTCTTSANKGSVSENVSSIVISCAFDLLSGTLNPLNIVPAEIRYSQGTDQFVFTTDNSNTLHIVNPFSGNDRTVDLLAQPQRLQLSPDGKLAAVLYGSVVDLIDVALAKRIRSSLIESSRSDVLLFNSGEAYLLGGDQWSGSPGFINARTGDVSTPNVQYAAGTYWGYGQFGLVADKINSLISISTGLSPSKLTKLIYDPSSPRIPTYSGDWPYHGDYDGSIPIGFNSKQSLVFTRSGLVAYTSSLKFAAQINVSQTLRSVSASSDDADLVIVLMDNSQPDGYSDKFNVVDPTVLLVKSSEFFPKIKGEQSYGGAVFHTAQQRRVAVLRTGDASQPARAKMWTYVF